MLAVLAIVLSPGLTLAAEFAPQRALWLSWPSYDHKRGVSVAREIAHLAETVAASGQPVSIVADSQVIPAARKLASNRRIDWMPGNLSEIWMRDFGPSFIVGANQLAVADFGFNYWGYEPASSPTSKQHEQFDRSVAKLRKVPTVGVGAIAEGGNHESNGAGTLMLVEAVERQRNPSLSRLQIEDLYRANLGVKTFLWLPQGVVEDGMSYEGPVADGAYLPITTGGHVDNIARFVAPHTIALAEVTEAEARKSPLAAENRRRLEAAREVIENTLDHEGKPFRIVRMPAPDLATETMAPGDAVYDFLATLSYSKGHVFPKGKPIRVALASSYMNFVIANRVVVTSRLYRPGLPLALREKDTRTIAILKKLFPTRKVIAISSRAINLGGGGLHCVTMHEPAVPRS